jgi:50S ribosomal protein L16 3-hydroxylase
MPIRPLARLGTLPVANFMRSHWQRKPLLMRNALPDFKAPIDAPTLFALAQRDDVEARLVTAFDGWRLQHGPLARRRIPSPRRPNWTLLVQGVDQHDERAAALLARFRFISDARLDDLMVSYASDGGGVGPHIDAYDVFLLQAQGRRRWRVGAGDPADLVPNLPLKILRRFKVEREWILEAGDLLYLPPGVAHEGTALGPDCMTCSIGFRAPQWRELIDPWLETQAARAATADRYSDRGAPATRRPARLSAEFIQAAFAALTRHRPTRADARDTLLAFLTEPKPNVVFERPRRTRSPAALRAAASRKGLRLDRRTRMLYAGEAMAINGEILAGTTRSGVLMQAFADRRSIGPSQAGAFDAAAWPLLAGWYNAGWLHLDGVTHDARVPH